MTLGAVLRSIDTPSAVVRSRECITTRHLLERALSDSKDALSKEHQQDLNRDCDGKCESISAFVVQLQLLLEGRGKFILVFDGIDRQREASPTLLPAISRLGEIVCRSQSQAMGNLIFVDTQPNRDPHHRCSSSSSSPARRCATYPFPLLYARGIHINRLSLASSTHSPAIRQ